MKRLALVAAVFALVGCRADTTPETTDTTTPTMAPAPAPITTDPMMTDTLAPGMDTLRRDTIPGAPVTPTP